jgi:hypothetical protein
MELETKPIARDSLGQLLAATRGSRPHARVIPRALARRHLATVREPSAMRGLILLLLIALGVRTLVLWIF